MAGCASPTGQSLSTFLNRSAHQLWPGRSDWGGSSPTPPSGPGGLGALLAQLKALLDRPTHLTSLSEKIRSLSGLLSPEHAFHLTPKDLDPLFVWVVGDIFGSQAAQSAKYGRGWHLTSLTRGRHSRDYAAALHFLAGSGGIMQWIQFLMLDPTCVYDYPVHRLPCAHPVRRHGSPSRPGWGAGGTQSEAPAPGSVSGVVSLTPFEYYFYHFFALISQGPEWLPALGGCLDGDSLYPVLFEDYMSRLIPVGGAQFLGAAQDTVPTSPPPTSGAWLTERWASTPRSPSGVSLFKADWRPSPSPSRMGVTAHRPLASGGPLTAGHAELWKSQVLLDIINQFWLRSFAIPTDHSSRDLSPPNDLVKLIRMFIKHLHFFFNGFHASQSEVRDSLQRGMFREVYDSLYLFFDHQFDHWPLDMSFRLILETWLSFIQPWRYRDPHQGEKDVGAFETVSWKHFLTNNGEFYDSLLQKVLLRFLRMDLGCNKNAFMLFRVTKVISQDGLPEALKIINPMPLRRLMGGNRPGGHLNLSGGLYESFGTDPSLMNAPEPAGTTSTTVFGEAFKPVLSSLMVKLAEARFNLRARKASLLDNKRGSEGKSSVSSWFAWLLDSTDQDSVEIEELDKIIQNLDFVSQKLQGVFSLSEDVTNSLRFTTRASLSQKIHDETEVMTPDRKWDLLNRKYRYSPKYHGHPDEKPLQSDEFHVVARLLHRISNWLNDSLPIQEYYGERGLWGTAVRQLCHGPSSYRLLGKYGERDEIPLPPRISLRNLAHKRIIVYVAMFYVLSLAFGTPAMTKLILFALTLWIIVLVGRTLTSPPTEEAKELEVSNEHDSQHSF